MATAQTSKAGNDRNKRTQSAGARDNESVTGERDENYNLVSVLYHALKAAETAQQYKRDAEKSGDKELVEFFEEARGGYVTFSEKAKRLLAARLEIDDLEDDEDEEEDDEEDED